MVQYGRSGRSSWAKSVRSSLSRTVMGRKGNSRKFYCPRLGRSSKWRVFFVKRDCVCGRDKTGWKETEHRPNVKDTHERRWFGRSDIIPWPRLFGLHSKGQTSKDIVDNYRNMFESQISAGSNRQATLLWETWRKHFLMVLRSGRSCKEMRGKILRTKQLNSYHAVTTTNSRKKQWICWTIVKRLLPNGAEVRVLGPHW